MNKNLNLVEILKDCPNGMELDCTMFDNAKFIGVENYENPICIRVGNMYLHLTQYGTWNFDENAKCIIFPKGKTTWEGFVHHYKFKDGDIVAKNNGNCIGITTGGHIYSYIPTYCALRNNSKVKFFVGTELWKFDRLATEEERQKLFDAIKESGYKWNAETKTLERLVEHKFDPKTLEPFDRVLVKVDSYWRIELFSNMYEYMGDIYYACARGSYKECIPYNDETKHLLGTSDEAPEYYRYWED